MRTRNSLPTRSGVRGWSERHVTLRAFPAPVAWVSSTSAARLALRARRAMSGLDAQQRTVILRGQHIQRAIRALTDVPDTLFQFVEHRLPAKFFPLLIEDDALDLPCARDSALSQSGHKDISFPV